jgi:hypothetical protein
VLPLLRIGLFFFAGVFVAAALVIVIEPETIGEFHTAFYFVIVTVATVGYGDLSLKSTGIFSSLLDIDCH